MTEGLTGSVARLTSTVLGITGTMPGLTGVMRGLTGATPGSPASSPEELAYFNSHIYSLATEAARKLEYDMQIIEHNYARGNEVSLGNEQYLKELIRLASAGGPVVRSDATGLQFFIIEGGGEGFLPTTFRSVDANDVDELNRPISPGANITRFDKNDILAVFEPDGSLIDYAAPLHRPTMVPGDRPTDRPKLSAETARNVWLSWDDRNALHPNGLDVFIYRNENWAYEWHGHDVPFPYLGLGVDDPYRSLPPGSGRVVIDMHKRGVTDGCIYIYDPLTPDLGDPWLATYEPLLIRLILAVVGKRPRDITQSRVPLGRLQKVKIV